MLRGKGYGLTDIYNGILYVRGTAFDSLTDSYSELDNSDF